MKTVNLNKKFVATIALIILAGTVACTYLTQLYFPQIGSIKAEGMEDPLEAWSEASYIIWQYNTTFYASRNMSTWDTELDSNKTYIQQMARDNLTTAGGTIFCKQVTWNQSLTCGANILIIEDYQGITTYYRDGRAVTLNAPANEASYVTGPYNSTFYYVEHGASGNYSYLGTNWASGINAAIDALPTTGGMIFLCGAGTWTEAVNINDIGVELRGEGKSTKITKGFNGNMIEMSGTAKYFQAVRDLYLSGAKASYTGSGIHLSYTYGTTDAQPILENLWINDMQLHGVFAEGSGTREIKGTNIVARICGGCGFYLGGTDGKYNDLVAENCDQDGIYTNGGSNQFVNCKVFGCGNSGVTYYGGNFDGDWQSLVGCYFQDNEYHGVYLQCNSLTMTGCVIQNNGRTSGTARGIVLAASGDGNVITGNVILDSGGYQDYGIYITSGAENNVITNNFLDGNDVVNIYVGDSDNDMHGNTGFVTENTGSSTNTTATTFVFNHGLADTATGVWASFSFSGWTSWTWTSTSTQVTITVTGTLPASMTCYYNVKYKP